ncbi:MAG: hypothetical protein ACE5G1_13360 [bacterium]
MNTRPTQAQGCCTPGTSALSGAERGLTSPHTFKVALSYQYNALDQAYQGNTPVEDLLQRTATVQTVNLDLEYGLVDRVSVLAIASFGTKRKRFSTTSAVGSFTETTEYRAMGFGDVTLLGKYQLVKPSIFNAFEIAIGGGAKLPVGSYTKKENGVRLAIDLQPGTGAADLLGWFFISRAFLKHHTTLSASLLYRYAGANPDGYKFGNEWLPTLAVELQPRTWLGLSLLVRARIANKDFAEGRFLPSTGGQTYFIVPTIIYREGRFAIRVYKQIPIYRDLIGTQLALTNIFGVELQLLIDISGQKTPKIPDAIKTR